MRKLVIAWLMLLAGGVLWIAAANGVGPRKAPPEMKQKPCCCQPKECRCAPGECSAD